MKVGTDAVLLGSWAGNKDVKIALDIGTGCGLLPLMLAQRFGNAKITGIDIHQGSVEDAQENFAASLWNERLTVLHQSLQEYTRVSKVNYDLIISNPPFFSESLLPPDEKKKIAKHTGKLSYEEIVISATRLLKPSGSLALILPYENRHLFKEIAENNGLYCTREMIVFPVAGKTPNRYLSEWGLDKEEYITEVLYIRNQDHNYTKEYKQHTKEFYLAL